MIDSVANVINGFEWSIEPDLVYKVWYPTRGADYGFLLEYGANIEKVSRTVDPSEYANAIRISGGQNEEGIAPTPQGRLSADVSAGIEIAGRWEKNFTEPEVFTNATLTEKADYWMADAQQLIPSYTVTLRSWGGPTEVCLVTVSTSSVKHGRLDVDTYLRVVAVDIEVSDDQNEKVSLTLGRRAPATNGSCGTVRSCPASSPWKEGR